MGLMSRKGFMCASTAPTLSRSELTEIARLGLGFTPEDRRILADLTVMENRRLSAASRRGHVADGTPALAVGRQERLFKLFPEPAGEMPDRPGGRMSGGRVADAAVARTPIRAIRCWCCSTSRPRASRR